jgi:hypothetical protein
MSSSKNLRVVCGCCNGSGEVSLSDALQSTYEATLKMARFTAAEISKKLKWRGQPTAINNRLDDLVRAKLLERERAGNRVFYSHAKNF